MRQSLILSCIHPLFHSPVFMDHLLYASYSSKHPGIRINKVAMSPQTCFSAALAQRALTSSKSPSQVMRLTGVAPHFHSSTGNSASGGCNPI